jgi:hypothetical protein
MTFTEVIDLIAPKQESVDTLINWMTENGIEVSNNFTKTQKEKWNATTALN